MTAGLLCLIPGILLAATSTPSPTDAAGSIDWGQVLMTMSGGLALFLLGMEVMSDSIKAVAGNGMKLFLKKMTGNRFIGAFSGALITGVLNSSSVTTVLVVGFISAGLMSLSQAISIIMGANVGSTFAAQIIAFNVTQYALIPVALGFLARFASKEDKVRNVGNVVMGLGLIFFGMSLMGDAMAPLRNYPPFFDLMARMNNPLLGILVGAGFTALVQSSAATTGIAITMASSGLITLEAGVALALGSNIGTCVTAILASLGKSRDAVRASAAHVLINVIGVLIWAWFIPEFCELIRQISPTSSGLKGTARLSAEVPRQIANAHTFFNVANTAILIWFTGLIAKLCQWIIPERPSTTITPDFLDRELLDAPTLALQRVQLEIGHIGNIINSMFQNFRRFGWKANQTQLAKVSKMENDIDILSTEILKYLASLPREGMTQKDGQQLLLLMTATNYLENLSDILKEDLVGLVNKANERKVVPSEMMGELMQGLFDTVWEASNLCSTAIAENNPEIAIKVLDLAPVVKGHINRALKHQADHLSPRNPSRLAIFQMEMEYVDTLKRIYNQAKRVSKQQVGLSNTPQAYE